jgi:uncharacterized membrane protein
MPNSFFILNPIIFFLDLVIIAAGLAYSARKAGKSVFQYYDPRPAFSILAAYFGIVMVVTALIFLDETVDVVRTIFYTFLFSAVNVVVAIIMFVYIARAIMGREFDPEFEEGVESDDVSGEDA